MKKILSAITALSFLSPALAAADDVVKASSPAKVARSACAAGGLARLATTKGKVLLSRGGSFSEIQDGAMLSAGDRILVREGSANVVVGKNVVSQAAAGSMLTITEKDGGICAAQVTPNPRVVAADLPMYKGAAPLPPEPEPEINPLWIVGGLAVVGAGVGLGVGLSNTGGSGPRVPLLPLLPISN